MTVPPKVRFVHLPDLHLGFQQGPWLTKDAFNHAVNLRENNVYRALGSLYDKISALDPPPQFILAPGDVFDGPRPPIRALFNAWTFWKGLDTPACPIYAIPGNHDDAEVSGLSPVFLLESMFDVPPRRLKTLGSSYWVEPCEGARIRCDYHRSGFSTGMSGFNVPDVPFSILMAHMPTKGPEEYKHSPPAHLPEGYNYYALGDLHRPWSNHEKHIHYAGAVDCIPGFNEEDVTPGFFVVDADLKSGGYEIAHHELDYYSFLDTLASAEDADEYLGWLDAEIAEGRMKKEDVRERCFARCLYDYAETRPEWVDKVAKRLTMFKTKIVSSRDEQHETVVPAKTESVDIEEELRMFFESQDAADLTEGALRVWQAESRTEGL